ncbi:MAG: LysE family transporter [Sedimentisphaerales bacterium]|jgi:threonine/homoserine/homoserine lactone efflux protein
MALVFFLVQVFIISFSGAIQPGPVTATAITMGARNRWAGVLLAIGHGIIEFPLMILIILGLGAIFQKPAAQIIIGAAGGMVLLYMAYGMFRTSGNVSISQAGARKDKPILAGIVLTASNPYFLIWWATVGLALATDATKLGVYAFMLFAIVHWFVDLIWVTALSLASFHGTTLLGPKSQTITLRICAAAMLLFGLFFIYGAVSALISA